MNCHKKFILLIEKQLKIVQFELVGTLDVENKKLPARQVTRKDFPAVGTFVS